MIGIKLDLSKPIFFLIVLLSSSFGLAQDCMQDEQKYEWEKIIPLITKETDVQKLYGEPYLVNGYIRDYRTEFGTVSVLYNGIKDTSKQICEGYVSIDTVYDFSVRLKQPIPLAKFNYDLKNYESKGYQRIVNDSGIIEYLNTRKGLRIITHPTENDEDEVVVSIWYSPTEVDKKSKCIKKK